MIKHFEIECIVYICWFFVPFNLGKEVLVKLYEYYLLIAVKTLITVIRYNLQLLLIDDLMSATRLKLYIVKND